jgi:hypothetical protein
MNPSTTNSKQRLEDLLIDQATVGLDDGLELELSGLMSPAAGADSNLYFETAALAQLGMLKLDTQQGTPAAALPAELRARILALAAQPRVADLYAQRERKASEQKTAGSGFGMRDIGWAVAAAFALAFVLIRPNTALEDFIAVDAATLTAQVDAAADRVVLPWSGPREPGYENVRGEVVWSDAQQRGYMRLAGLPANDATAAQYQLWIVDPERSAQPVDGGVFNMPSGAGEVLIQITAKLAVDEPTVFAITLEQPGGVVVSAGPLLVLAAQT